MNRSGFIEPLDRLALFNAGKFDDLEIVAKSLTDALVAILIGHLHAAKISRDADVVGNQDEQRVGVGILHVAGDGGKFRVVLAASVQSLDSAHEEDLETCHQRRRAATVENLDDLRGYQDRTRTS